MLRTTWTKFYPLDMKEAQGLSLFLEKSLFFQLLRNPVFMTFPMLLRCINRITHF